MGWKRPRAKRSTAKLAHRRWWQKASLAAIALRFARGFFDTKEAHPRLLRLRMTSLRDVRFQ
jgi:hypothetical protein